MNALSDLASVLYIDTATSGCYAAYADLDGIGVARSAPMDRGQAEALVPMLEDILSAAPRRPAWIAVAAGPGSFTGVRIGLAAANTLAQVYDIPVYGITSFDAYRRTMRAAQPESGPSPIIVIETRRQDFFISHDPDDAAMHIMDADAVRRAFEGTPHRFIGDGVERLAQIITQWPVGWIIDRTGIMIDPAAIAHDLLRAPPAMTAPFPVVPIYLRDAETSTPVRGTK